jgi:hypothetical protein
VQNRQLQTWLSEEEYAQIETHWSDQIALREALKDKPSKIQHYKAKLRQANLMHNRAESYSNRGNHATAKTC